MLRYQQDQAIRNGVETRTVRRSPRFNQSRAKLPAFQQQWTLLLYRPIPSIKSFHKSFQRLLLIDICHSSIVACNFESNILDLPHIASKSNPPPQPFFGKRYLCHITSHHILFLQCGQLDLQRRKTSCLPCLQL